MEGLPRETFDDLYEDAPCAYVSTLVDGTIVRVNRTFEEWTGHARDSLVGRRRFQDLLTPAGRIYHETHFAPLLRMQGDIREISLQVVRADGSRLPALVNSVLRRDGEGAAVIRTTIFDATDRNAYEQELLLARRRAERLQDLTARLAMAAGEEEIRAAVRGAVADALDVDEASVVEDAGAIRLSGDRELSPEDEGFLRACAQQTAQALDRARLYDRERKIAHALQSSMLTRRLPRLRGFRAASFYEPSVQTMEVGGDWFDAIAIDEHRVGVVVGDVVGRGIEAASAMGQLRSAVRALAAARLGPAEILQRLDDFVETVEVARSATLVYGEVSLTEGRLRYACAGHPPPILVPPEGAPELLWGGRSAPLGAFARSGDGRAEATVDLAPGTRLVMYTDGLVERRDRPIHLGLDVLLAAVHDRRHAPLEVLAGALASSLREEGDSRDDVCLLGIGFGVPDRLVRRMPARLEHLRALRADLRAWLEGHDFDLNAVGRLVLAASEAAVNAIEHGCGCEPAMTVGVDAWLEASHVVVEISDAGAWRPPDVAGDRGRGLALMRQLVDEVEVDTVHGTHVRLRTRRSA